MNRARLLVNNQTEGIARNMNISNIGLKFSATGDKLFFNVSLRPVPPPKIDPKHASVDVWSYQDQYLQEEQLFKLKYRSNPMLLSVVSIASGKAITLKNT